MRKARLAAIVMAGLYAASPIAAESSVSAPDPAYVPVKGSSPLEEKIFYFITLLRTLPAARRALLVDTDLEHEKARMRDLLQTALRDCKGEPACELTALRWSPGDARRLGEAVVRALDRAGLAHALAERHLRPSGQFQRYASLDDGALELQAWLDAAAAMDRIIEVYGLRRPPAHPDIDAALYPLGDKAADAAWSEDVYDLMDVTLETQDSSEPFVSLPFSVATSLLDLNERDEAARLEPLAKGDNAAAYAAASGVVWSRWTYSAILIPGAGPDRSDVPLSPEGKLRVRLGALRYKRGLAPFIIVSGGFVHPARTHFAEALEMKRTLMEAYAIPERAILVDPYARHTTTNLRNAARILFDIRAPLHKPALVTTTAPQSGYIASKAFTMRCVQELGYACTERVVPISRFDNAVVLPLSALHRDARDPLDP